MPIQTITTVKDILSVSEKESTPASDTSATTATLDAAGVPPSAQTKARIVGILSGKGGVGKSMLVSNLGALAAKWDEPTLLIDGDLSNPCLSLQAGLPHSGVGLQEVLEKPEKAADAVVINPVTGVRLLPSSIKFSRETRFERLKEIVARFDAYRTILIDSSPGITSNTFGIIDASDEILIVTTPDIQAVSSAAKIALLCREQNRKVTGLIINRITGAKFELNEKEIYSTVGVPVLCKIPEDHKVPESISVRVPIANYAPNSPAGSAIRAFGVNFYGQSQSLLRPKPFISILIARLRRIIDAIFSSEIE